MTIAFPRLSAIAYSIGNIRPVSVLAQQEHAGADVMDALEKNGLRHFCEDERSTPEMCVDSVRQTLARADLRPEDIDAIVVGPSIAAWDLQQDFALLNALHEAGFRKKRIIGLSLQACSVTGAALKIAGDLVKADDGTRNVLVIVFGRGVKGSRVAPQGTTLFSDGAASCLVTKDGGEFEILANESLVDPLMTTMEWVEENFPKFMQGGIAGLSDVTKKVYAQTKVSAKEVTVAFGTNGSSMYLNMIGLAASLPGAKVYRTALPKYAHVFGCDNLISLKDYGDETALSKGDNLLFVSWAPYAFSASMLRYVGH